MMPGMIPGKDEELNKSFQGEGERVNLYWVSCLLVQEMAVGSFWEPPVRGIQSWINEDVNEGVC